MVLPGSVIAGGTVYGSHNWSGGTIYGSQKWSPTIFLTIILLPRMVLPGPVIAVGGPFMAAMIGPGGPV